VSAQIKRLQFLLGVAGTRHEMLIRLGTPSDCIASILPGILAQFRKRWPDVRSIVRTDIFDSLLRQLYSGELDIFAGLSLTPPLDARHRWAEELVWVCGAESEFNLSGSVPLVSHGEASVYHRLAVTALKMAGLDWEDVFTGPSTTSLTGAVVAGLGVMALTRRRAHDFGSRVWDDASLPKLPDLYSGICIREGGARAAYEQLADEIGAVVNASRGGIRRILTVADQPSKTGSAA